MKILFLGNGWLARAMQEKCSADGQYVQTISQKSHSDYNFNLEIQSDRMKILELCANFDLLVININPANFLLDFVKELIHILSTKSKVFFSSSISVYDEDQGVVDEDSEPMGQGDNAIILKQCEQLLVNSKINCIIARWGGLYDEERRIENYLKNSFQLSRPYAFVNLTHKKTCLIFFQYILSQFIADSIKGSRIFNVISINNVQRIKYYESIHHKFDFDDLRKGKQVLSKYKLPELAFNN